MSPRPQPEILHDYLLGRLTNSPPRNRITAVEKLGDDVRISFTTFTNFGYRIEQADDLTDPRAWSVLSEIPALISYIWRMS